MSNIKKKANSDITSKRLKIKNKKDVAKVLTNNKHTAVTAKKSSNVRKKPTVKKVVVEQPKVNTEEIKNLDIELVEKKPEVIKKPVTPTKKITYKKAKPINKQVTSEKPVTKKIEPEEKEPIEEEKEVTSVVKDAKKEIKIKKKPEDNNVRATKLENLDNIKKRAKKINDDKNKNKPKVPSSKKVKSVYDPEKNRWVIKEDKSKPKDTNKKGKKNVSAQPQNLDDTASYLTQTDLGKFKNKFFEEVDVHEYKKVKKEIRAKWPKRIIICAIILIILGVAGFTVYKLNQERIKRNLNLYTKYKIGQEVQLSDDSKWYILEDSDGSKATVVIMPEGLSDLNFDGKIDDSDKKPFSKGSVELDSKEEGNIAYFLENDYLPKFEEKYGKVDNITLMTSEQYVAFRTAMNYPLEWKEENILANDSTKAYYINGSKNGKILIVRRNGTYKMVDPTPNRGIRLAITIKKDMLKKD